MQTHSDTCWCSLRCAERCGATADVERTYCFATGSFRRGAPQSSDIDILICLPPSLAGYDCGAFMTQVRRQATPVARVKPGRRRDICSSGCTSTVAHDRSAPCRSCCKTCWAGGCC